MYLRWSRCPKKNSGAIMKLHGTIWNFLTSETFTLKPLCFNLFPAGIIEGYYKTKNSIVKLVTASRL